MFKLARRVLVFAVLLGLVYTAVTFAQVWSASRRDEARSAADAIVVLGAAQYNGQPSPVLRSRLDHAAKLYSRDVAATIVVTGGQQVNDPTSNTEASAAANYLARTYKVPQRAILRENAGCNTWDSLASTANELRKRGKERVVLVSDPFHSARVAAIAQELHLDATVSPTRTSPISGGEELRYLFRETAVVATARVVGFRRLMGVNEIARPSADCA